MTLISAARRRRGGYDPPATGRIIEYFQADDIRPYRISIAEVKLCLKN